MSTDVPDVGRHHPSEPKSPPEPPHSITAGVALAVIRAVEINVRRLPYRPSRGQELVVRGEVFRLLADMRTHVLEMSQGAPPKEEGVAE